MEFDELNTNFHQLYKNTYTTNFLTENHIDVFNIYDDGDLKVTEFTLLTATS